VIALKTQCSDAFFAAFIIGRLEALLQDSLFAS
jgi:hypothetical protein